MNQAQLAAALEGVELTVDGNRVVAVDGSHSDLIAEYGGILLLAFHGAVQRKGVGKYAWRECPHCKDWLLRVKNPTNCPGCKGSFDGARVAEFTWAGANRHGRPPHPNADKDKAAKKAATKRGAHALAITRGR